MTPDQKAILALTAENERLRGLLREAKPVTVELVALLQATSKHLPASAPIDMAAAQSAMGDLTGWISRIDAALAGAAVQPSDVASTFADCELAMGMEYETDPSGVPTEADLLAWGYAPGNYSSRCFTCGRMIDGVDKRCGICRACAITRWTHAKARAAVPTTEVQK